MPLESKDRRGHCGVTVLVGEGGRRTVDQATDTKLPWLTAMKAPFLLQRSLRAR